MSNELDFLGVIETSQVSIEAVDPRFIREKLREAQKKTWQVFDEIRSQLTEGLTEDDARKLALRIFQNHKVTKHWHKPYIRFGSGTMLSFHNPLQEDYRLKKGDAVYIDVGPIWPDPELDLSFEGDVGDTFSFGSNPEVEQFAQTVRQLFKEAEQEWRTKKLTGEQIYRFLKDRATALGYQLAEKVDGHRIGDFPHHKYSKSRLAHLQFKPSTDLWVLEIHMIHPSLNMGAFYEDILTE
jgi:methionine aminopeptidase